MKSRKKIFFLLVGVLVIVLALVVYIRVKSNLDASTKNPAPTPSVGITSVTRSEFSRKLNYTGDILAIEQANIYSRVNGNIEKIYVDIGDYVNQGKLLATIDRAVYYQTLRQTEGLFKQAKATVENNRVNYEREKDLYDKGLVSKSDLDNARTTLNVSEAQVETALANYRNAQTQLSYCTITAPFSGYITKRLLDRGQYVGVGGTSQASVIFTLSRINEVKLMVNVLEKDVPLLENVTEADVTTGTYPGEVFKATIQKISQLVDLNTRTMPVEIRIDNPDRKLKPGMFAQIELILQKVDNAMVLPSQCVLTDDKGKYVYVVSPDTTAQQKYVKIGIEQNNNMEITSGLSGDEKILITGQTLVKNGSKVKISK